MNTTDLDGPAVTGLIRRLHEEQATAVYWHRLAESEREAKERALTRLRTVRQSVGRDREPDWLARCGWVLVGVVVGLVWAYLTRGVG